MYSLDCIWHFSWKCLHRELPFASNASSVREADKSWLESAVPGTPQKLQRQLATDGRRHSAGDCWLSMSGTLQQKSLTGAGIPATTGIKPAGFIYRTISLKPVFHPAALWSLTCCFIFDQGAALWSWMTPGARAFIANFSPFFLLLMSTRQFHCHW